MHLLTCKPTHAVRKTRPHLPEVAYWPSSFAMAKWKSHCVVQLALSTKPKKIKKEAHSGWTLHHFATTECSASDSTNKSLDVWIFLNQAATTYEETVPGQERPLEAWNHHQTCSCHNLFVHKPVKSSSLNKFNTYQTYTPARRCTHRYIYIYIYVNMYKHMCASRVYIGIYRQCGCAIHLQKSPCDPPSKNVIY